MSIEKSSGGMRLIPPCALGRYGRHVGLLSRLLTCFVGKLGLLGYSLAESQYALDIGSSRLYHICSGPFAWIIHRPYATEFSR